MIERRHIVELGLLVVLTAACAGSAPTAFCATRASWSASASVRISISTQAQDLPVFRVGKSKATYVDRSGPFPTIAQIDGHGITLDFGSVRQGNSNNSPEVLLIENRGSSSIALVASLSGNVRTLFSSVRLTEPVLRHGRTSALAMRVDAKHAAPGSYEGTLTISDLAGTFSRDIPVRLRVVAREGSGSGGSGQPDPECDEPGSGHEPESHDGSDDATRCVDPLRSDEDDSRPRSDPESDHEAEDGERDENRPRESQDSSSDSPASDRSVDGDTPAGVVPPRPSSEPTCSAGDAKD